MTGSSKPDLFWCLRNPPPRVGSLLPRTTHLWELWWNSANTSSSPSFHQCLETTTSFIAEFVALQSFHASHATSSNPPPLAVSHTHDYDEPFDQAYVGKQGCFYDS